jgi:hypothetical protein
MEIREATPEEDEQFAKLVDEIHTVEDKTVYPPVPREFHLQQVAEIAEYRRNKQEEKVQTN